MSKTRIVFILVCCLPVLVFAQPTPVVMGSKDKILIGEPFKITLELRAVDRNASIHWKFPDTLRHFEYISFDTADILKREITITSWDSGVWKLENISVVVPSNVNSKPIELKFPAKEIIVEYDTTGSKILNDVKPIIEVDDTGEKWIAYSIITVTLLSLLLLIYLFRKWKTKKAELEIHDSSVTPLDEFMQQVAKLKEKNWASQLDQKINFSELSAAVKRYLQRTLRKPFQQFTTDETAIELQNEVSREKMQLLTQNLRLADAVKFAKYSVPAEECEAVLQQIKSLIQKIDEERK